MLTSNDNLDVYIQQNIQADDEFLSGSRAAIDKLVTLLQHNVPQEIRPYSVVKGGSLGKGTAIKGSSDIDLVLMITKYQDVRKLHKDLPRLLELLHSSLDRFPNVNVTGETEFGVQIEYTGNDGIAHDVDILLAIDVITYYGGVNNVYEAMRTRDQDIRGNYSACLVQLQAELFRIVGSTKLKSLIRFVKYWKKECEKQYKAQHRGERVARWPTSYVMEIVTLDSWSRAGSPNSFDMRKALYAVLRSVANHHHFQITLEDRLLNYNRSMIERATAGPFIMDPCNPFNNLYLTAGQRTAWNWNAVEQAAQSFQRGPLFLNLSQPIDKW